MHRFGSWLGLVGRPRRLLFAIGLLALLPFASAIAADGDLDTTFGGDGGVRITPQTTGGNAHQVVGLVVRDDVIVVASSITNTVTPGNSGGVIMLLNDEGQKINNGPSTEAKTQNSSARFYGMIELPNDEVLAFGSVDAANPAEKRDLLVKRFKVNLNSSPAIQELSSGASAGQGVFQGSDDVALAAAVEANGDVVIAGYSNYNNADHLMAVRLKAPNYDLDQAFGSNGRLNTSMVGRFHAVAIDSNGKLLFSGQGNGFGPQTPNGFVARFTQNGQPDVQYGPSGNGVSQLNLNQVGQGRLVALHLSSAQYDPNGCAAIAAGELFSNSDRDWLVVRFSSNGILQGQPIQVQRPNKSDTLVGMYVMADDKVLLTGSTTDPQKAGRHNFLLARLDGGQLDASFGQSGVVELENIGQITDGFSSDDSVMSVSTLQTDGKLLTGGYDTPVGSALASQPQAIALRFEFGGALDTFSVEKSASAGRVGIGDELSYSLQMTGPANTTFLLTDTLPSELTNYTYTVSSGVVVTEVSASDYDWEVTLPAGGGSIQVSGVVTSTTEDDGQIVNGVSYGVLGEDLKVAGVSTYLDVTPPDTSFGTTPPAVSASTSAEFEFGGSDLNGPVTKLECSLDGAAFAACVQPLLVPVLASGVHIFSVRAIDTVGLVDPTPATYSWTVELQDFDPTESVTETLPSADGYTMTVAIPGGAVDLTGDVAMSFGDLDRRHCLHRRAGVWSWALN